MSENAPSVAKDARRISASSKRTCTEASGDRVTCFSRIRTDADGNPVAYPSPTAAGGFGPADLSSAYAIPTSPGPVETIAIVDAYDLPTAASDLATYRAAYGLPACGAGCFTKVGQTGSTTELPGLTPSTENWNYEIALDLAMVSVGCPSCQILLVETNSTYNSDLYAGLQTALSMGASVVTNSWGGPTDIAISGIGAGQSIFASTGDDGYVVNTVEYPAGLDTVTAVGGTTLSKTSGGRGWTEAAWMDGSSGCSAEPRPSWQEQGICNGKMVADVSAVAADVNMVLGGAWYAMQGTSVAAPLVAGIYAFTGQAGASPSFAYANSGEFFDVTTGSNGSCGGTFLCTAIVGYDGPTGNGTPNAATMVVPVVSRVSPPAGVNGGGVRVEVDGAHFSASGVQITFGGAAATDVSCGLRHGRGGGHRSVGSRGLAKHGNH